MTLLTNISLGFLLSFLLWPIIGQAASCNISSTSINFGSYDVFNAINYDTTGSITLECNGRPNYSIEISQGTSTYSNYTRLLSNTINTDKLIYNLYTDASRSTIWGNGTYGTSMITGRFPPATKTITMPIYARAPGGQDVSIGQYTDTLIITVNYD